MASSDLPLALEVVSLCLGASVSPDTLPAKGSSSLADTIISHRLSRLALDHANTLGLDEADHERVKNDALAHTHAAFQLVGHTTQLVSTLQAAGLRFLVIKGVALAAHTSSVASRGAGDVDILLAPDDVPRLHDILDGASYRPALALPNPHSVSGRVWRWLDREATYLGNGTQVDVHWRISSQHRLFPRFDTLYERRATVMVADTPVPTLGRQDSLAAACFHAYFDQFQPARSLVDVVAVMRAMDQDTQLPRYPTPLQRLVSGVLDLVKDVFPGVVDAGVVSLLRQLPTPPRIVRDRFEEALITPRVRWEVEQDRGALVSKFFAESAFDNPFTAAPRFLGKRMFDFPHWSAATPTTGLRQAFSRRLSVERSRRTPRR